MLGAKPIVSFGGSSGDTKDQILAIMREMTKTNKYVHKNDIYTMIQGKVNYADFEKAVERLSNDGSIYSTYDVNLFGLSD